MTASHRKSLLLTAAAHLAVAVVSMWVALRRRLPYHLPLLHGDPKHVARDSLLMGTALSEPVLMMGAQAAALVVLSNEDSVEASALLGMLGGANVPGYLLERHVRSRLRPSGWDATETPLVLAGLILGARTAKLAWDEASRS
jgi:hypothetical protein